MEIESHIAEHYTSGRLEKAIYQALAEAGKDRAHLTVEDFAPFDEFHVGGLEATKELAAQMDLRPGIHLLDVGCGIGGPARYFAAEHGAKVDGIDLTEEFVDVANNLTQAVKLHHLVTFQKASALQLPFAAETFDGAYMVHVGMNIANKEGVYREVRRVLKADGLFVVFDILRVQEGPLQFPLPWAASEETSFVAEAKEYRDALENAGFQVVNERGRGAFSAEYTERMVARMAQSGPPLLGLHLLMGEKTPLMLRNVLGMMRSGVLEPIELYARPV